MRQLSAVPCSGGRIALSILCVATLVCGVFGLLKISSGERQAPNKELTTGSIQQSPAVRKPESRDPMAAWLAGNEPNLHAKIEVHIAPSKPLNSLLIARLCNGSSDAVRCRNAQGPHGAEPNGNAGPAYAAFVAASIGSIIEGSSFSGLLTRVEIGHIRTKSAGNSRIKSRGSACCAARRCRSRS
jgi:hypothetical protein